MRQLIYDTEYNKWERFPGEREFVISNNEDDSRIVADNHSSPDSLVYLDEAYIRVLELISYDNYSIGMKNVIAEEYGEEFDYIIDFLRRKRLVIYQGRNWLSDFKADLYILSRRGHRILDEFGKIKDKV